MTTDRGPVLYLHYGAQCSGYRYMMQGARGAAALLSYDFRSSDVAEEPHLAVEHGMFFPGMIVIGGEFRLVYPGSPEQIARSYRLRGPLPGEMSYRSLPPGKVEHIKPLSPGLVRSASKVCLPAVDEEGVADKERWMGRRNGGALLGYVGYSGVDMVAVLELVPEMRVPYPLPHRDPGGLFITCLYGKPHGGRDFRPGLLEMALKHLATGEYRRLSAVSGLHRPYPNGPLCLFDEAGFTRGQHLGQALLRHQYEDMYFVTKELN